MSDFERLGQFYLGRHHDLVTGATGTQKLLYNSKDLTTHAVCVGMTGSGKTGLCLSLLEEAAIDGVPAIAIDPKGDLGNLLLAFPDLQPNDFRPWIDEGEAARKGVSPEEFAAGQAALWRDGLAQWDEAPERIRTYLDSADRVIYTPGSSAGIPLTILKSFDAPPRKLVEDTDAFRERVSSASSGLLALLGIDADPVRSREHIFVSNVLDTAWRGGRNLDLAGLIGEIQKPPFEKVGIMDLESVFPARDRNELAMSLNNLLAAPSFQSWLQGEPLDVKRLLYTDSGRPRLSILSIAHLSDAERMFFVTILLNEVVAWMRTQPGTSSLRAILYMDEVFGYFPPTANPPSKLPMLTLLKQARAFGLGCVLATQNPVDLDYKGLSNAGTWFLGRLQTERDKARVLEGLEGASAQAGSTFNRGEMERTLAALGSRVFLMNNVHDDAPIVFHTRWALSFLRGPLTRGQIKQLMDPVRDHVTRQANETPLNESAPTASVAPRTADRPAPPTKIRQVYLVVRDRLSEGQQLVYRPGLLGSGKIRFVYQPWKIDHWQEVHFVQTTRDGKLPNAIWELPIELKQAPIMEDQPQPHAEFGELPPELAGAIDRDELDQRLADWIYHSRSEARWCCAELDAFSQPGESEADFRIRVNQLIRERRDAEQEAIHQKYRLRREKLADRVKRCEKTRDTQKGQFWGKVFAVFLAAAELAAAFVSGGATKRRTSSTISRAKQAATERGQQSRAQAKLDQAREDLQQLDEKIALEIAEAAAKLSDGELDFERAEIRPRNKDDVVTNPVQLAWLPFGESSEGTAVPVY